MYIDTLDSITLRAHGIVQKNGVALRLVRSRCEGKLTTASVNRMFLKNALEIGIDRIGISPNEPKPLICYGVNKTFVIMPLEGEEPKFDMDNMTVLSSDIQASVPPKSAKPIALKTEQRSPVLSRACKSVKNPTGDKPKGKAAILADAEKLRQAYNGRIVAQIARRVNSFSTTKSTK